MTSYSKEAVFISGGTSGLGFELAKHFTNIGKNVIFCGRNVEAVHITLDYLKNISVGEQVILGFSNPLSSLFYILAQACLALPIGHLSHGIFSIFQTLGVNHPNIDARIKLARCL